MQASVVFFLHYGGEGIGKIRPIFVYFNIPLIREELWAEQFEYGRNGSIDDKSRRQIAAKAWQYSDFMAFGKIWNLANKTPCGNLSKCKSDKKWRVELPS